jgi:hypothetical protein
MNDAAAVNWIDEWLAQHRERCAEARIDASVVERYPGLFSRLIVACPSCHASASGAIRDDDLLRVLAWLESPASGSAS